MNRPAVENGEEVTENGLLKLTRRPVSIFAGAHESGLH
jgi:hypothetical protein